MDALKNMFNPAYYKTLANHIKAVYPAFDANNFLKAVTTDLEPLSLNQRMRNTSVGLRKYLPADYKHAVAILKEVIPGISGGYTNLVFPDFVGLHGLHDFKTSLPALKFFTTFGSSEFAIREFLKRDFNTTIQQMYQWAGDNNHHVRRLASEGSRPRLPWSFKLDAVIKNPELTKPILEALKADDELYVRKSVANHLNDLSKDNTDYMLALISSWDKTHPHTAWIIKHASRSLIKKGHSASLQVFDFEKNPKVHVDHFNLINNSVKLGEYLAFEFELVSQKNKSQKLVIDYVIHYRKKGGDLLPKVFKLKELNLKPGEKVHLTKKQLLKDFTTRKHYAGKHLLQIQVNGKIVGEKEFRLFI